MAQSEDVLPACASASVASELVRVCEGVRSLPELPELPELVEVVGESTGGVGIVSSGSEVTTSEIWQAASSSALRRSAHSGWAMAYPAGWEVVARADRVQQESMTRQSCSRQPSRGLSAKGALDTRSPCLCGRRASPPNNVERL